MLASQLRTSLVLAALLASGGALAQESVPTSSADQLFAAWKLKAATGVPGPAALAELEELLAAAKAGGASPELLASMMKSTEALHAQLAPKPQAAAKTQASAAAEHEVLRLALKTAIVEGDHDFFRAIGDRAVPALKEMALAWDGSPPPGQQEPALYWLSWLSAPDALDVGLKHMESKSFLLKRSTITVLDGAFKRSTVWRPEGASDWRLVRPEWEQILHLALEEPSVAPRTLESILGAFIKKGQLPRSLGPIAVEARAQFRSQDVIPTEGLWYLELAMASEVTAVRSSAASFVTRCGSGDAVLKLARDADENVRRALAWTLLANEESRYLDRDKWTTETAVVRVPRTPEVLESFALLAGDTSRSVRSATLESLEKYRSEFGDAPFSGHELAVLFPRVTDQQIREELIESIRRMPEPDRLAGAKALIEDLTNGDDKARMVSIRLDPASFGLSQKDDFFVLLDLWHANGFFAPNSYKKSPFRAIARTELNRLVESAGLDPEPFIDRARSWGFVDSLAPQPNGRGELLYPWVRGLSEESRARLVRIIYASAQLPAHEFLIAVCDASATNRLIDSYEILTDLVQDDSAPSAARLWAVQALRSNKTAMTSAHLATIASLVAETKEPYEARRALAAVRTEQQGEFLRLLAAEPEATAEQFLCVSPSALELETIDALWPHVASATWDETDGVSMIVAGLAMHSSERLDPRLTHVDFSLRNVRWGLFHAARETRNPLLIPLLREVVARPDFQDDGEWYEASLALGAYMNAESAKILLEAARFAPSAPARGHAMKALQEITQWRETAAAWEKSIGADAKRSQAISELVQILDDGTQSEEARAAAMRGLGLLGAVEELPRIVRALSAESEAIQEAARSSMERLEK